MKKIALTKFGSDIRFNEDMLDTFAKKKNLDFFYYDNYFDECSLDMETYVRAPKSSFAIISLIDLGDRFSEFPKNNLFFTYDIPRDDPDLIFVIEQFGLDYNKIVEIPDNVDWEIQSCEACEWIAEKHRTWS